MKQLTACLRLLFGVVLLMSCSLALSASYSFKTIDFPDASQTSVFGINDAGHVVGSYANVVPKNGFLHGFLFKDGNFTTVDFPVVPQVPTDFFTIAYDINSRDQIVGTDNVGLGLPFGFLFDENGFQTVHAPGVLIAEARGITDTGTICGFFAFPDRPNQPGLHGYLLKQGVFTIIDVPGSTTTKPMGINNAEDTVGVFIDAGGKSHGYLMRGGNITEIERPGAETTTPFGINSAGAIVGVFTKADVKHGFILVNGKFKTIDVPGATFTEVFGINSDGQIVGDYRGADGITHGFIATPKARDDDDQKQQDDDRDHHDDQHHHDNDVMKLPFSHK